ncbi:MAG: Flp pilus assembly protein CpaB [Phycisphaerae bacterium]|nr:Flp pilus assembly protein CpaB [Phycisphaerae bacterium]
MPETIVWNKKLLVVSLMLAVLAVAMFYLYISAQEKKLRGDTVEILQWSRSLNVGDKISAADTTVARANSATTVLKGVLRKASKDEFIGKHVSRNVSRGDKVYYKDILESSSGTPADKITPGMRGLSLRVDPNYTPGNILRVGGRIDILGRVSPRGKLAKTYTLVRNLRVLAVGGHGENTQESIGSKRRRKYNPGIRVYRSVTVEVSPELAEQLVDLLSRVQGKIWLTVRNPGDAPKRKSETGINSEVLSVLSLPPAKK